MVVLAVTPGGAIERTQTIYLTGALASCKRRWGARCETRWAEPSGLPRCARLGAGFLSGLSSTGAHCGYQSAASICHFTTRTDAFVLRRPAGRPDSLAARVTRAPPSAKRGTNRSAWVLRNDVPSSFNLRGTLEFVAAISSLAIGFPFERPAFVDCTAVRPTSGSNIRRRTCLNPVLQHV